MRRQWKRGATTIRDRRQQRSRIVSLRPSISREPPGQRAHACWKFCTFGSRRRASLHVGRLLNEARREREFRSRLLLHERKQHFSRSRSAAVRTMSQRVGSPRGGSRATAGACDRDRQSESTGAGARRQDLLVYAHLFLAHQRFGLDSRGACASATRPVAGEQGCGRPAAGASVELLDRLPDTNVATTFAVRNAFTYDVRIQVFGVSTASECLAAARFSRARLVSRQFRSRRAARELQRAEET